MNPTNVDETGLDLDAPSQVTTWLDKTNVIVTTAT